MANIRIDMVIWWLCVVELFKGYALAEMWIFWDGGMRFFKYLTHLFIFLKLERKLLKMKSKERRLSENVGAR